jgi:nucleoside-diphosphate-sugar epimerase
LITGATGFIGQRLQAKLLGAGRKVTALIRPDSKHKDRLLPGCKQIETDLSDSDQLNSAVAESGTVVYCAGSVRGRTLEDFRAANIAGVAAIAQAIRCSTCEIPLLLISSLAASRPEISDYARSKHEGELQLRSFANFPWTIIRPPAVYGPGDREMLPILKLARHGIVTPAGPPGQRVSLLHADDLCAAVLAWLDAWRACVHQCYAIDDGQTEGYDWRTIAETASGGKYRSLPIPSALLFGVAKANLLLSGWLDYAPMLTPGKARELTQADWICDNTPFTLATGWTPGIKLREGVEGLFGGIAETAD